MKPITSPTSYRQFCMINNVAKLMERLVLYRLNKAIAFCENLFFIHFAAIWEDLFPKVILPPNAKCIKKNNNNNYWTVVSQSSTHASSHVKTIIYKECGILSLKISFEPQ